jgi:hypothetical protein
MRSRLGNTRHAGSPRRAELTCFIGRIVPILQVARRAFHAMTWLKTRLCKLGHDSWGGLGWQRHATPRRA